jgi:phage terminase small subunit
MSNDAQQRPIRLDDDRMDYGRPLRERYEDFCGHFVATRNPMQAYRLAFVVDKARTPQWVQAKAKAMLADPAIMARVQALRDDAAAQTLTSVRELLADYHDIATADPNELMSYCATACMHCWADEYATLCAAALDKGEPLPTITGPYYGHYRPSNLQCEHCGGAGDGGFRVVLHDTRRLSPQARKLFKGVKETQTKFGTNFEVMVHDQMAARDALGRVLGAFKEGIPVTPASTHTQAIPHDAREQDAGRAYLTLIQGGKAG